MFYSVFVLGKKGPLSRVWLAAHWDKKITKAQILETNIVESVESILQPRVRLSLRTSSHLLLGIVRIYSRKTIYLLQDCQDAAFRIKSAYRPGVVDMPQDKCEAAIAAITLPDMMGFEENFDLPLEPPIQIEVLQSNANIRNITLIEEVSSVQVDDPLSMSNVRNWADFSSIPPVGDASRTIQRGSVQGTHIYDGSNPLDMFDRPQIDDGFGGQLGLIDADDLFAIPVAPTEEEQEGQMADVQPPPPPEIDEETPIFTGHSDHPQQGAQSVPTPQQDQFDLPAENLDGQPEKRMSGQRQRPSLLEDMVLEPLRGSDRKKRRKKRRALGIIFDEVTTMSGDQMTAQMADTKGILMPMNLAPPTKQLMEFKKTGRFEVLFTRPERKLPSKTLLSVNNLD